MSSASKNIQSVIKQFQRNGQKDNISSTPKTNFLITEPADFRMTTASTNGNSSSVKFSRPLQTLPSHLEHRTPQSPQAGTASPNRSSGKTSLRASIRPSVRQDFKKQSISAQNIPPRKEKKFDLNDFIVLEDNYTDLIKIVKNYYRQINLMLKGFGSEDLKEYLLSLWDIDVDKKEAKDLLPILEAVFTVIIKFYNELEEENYQFKRPPELKESSKIAKDYLFLLQTQEAEVRALTRENQQLKISIAVYQEKLKNSEVQATLLANYAQKEMENIKQEFQFAINDLKQREEDVDMLKKELTQKEGQVESLDEQLVSVLILEHKIRALGAKNTKDIEKTVFEYNEKLKEMDKSSREALRKERQDNESRFADFKGKINILTIENRKLQFENKSRIQQLNDIILEKEQQLQSKVEILQDCQEKLALRNREVYLITCQKDKYGGSGVHLPTVGSNISTR